MTTKVQVATEQVSERMPTPFVCRIRFRVEVREMSGMAEIPPNEKLTGYCTCGHCADAHGTKGMICGACACKQFVLRTEPVKATK